MPSRSKSERFVLNEGQYEDPGVDVILSQGVSCYLYP